MLTIYGDVFSGNCYKVKLLLEFLQVPYQWQAVDILAGETQTPEFLTLNPNGKIPLLLLPDGQTLSESNAILGYLAETYPFPENRQSESNQSESSHLEQNHQLVGNHCLKENSPFLPAAGLVRAKVYEWLFFEQYSHEPYIAVARFIQKYQGMPESRLEEYQSLQAGGHKALSIMEKALNDHRYLVGETLTIADVALYAYTHVAHEGGFDLSDYPHIQRWCQDIASHPYYVSIG